MIEQDVKDFRAWREARLDALRYPECIRTELARARELWLAGVKRRL